ncbi:DExH-box splicing factor binding site-domain-containing protein [Zopfochytrium polystomum]|nr:DExH-box splicing factor binding site-domain-containing protein [Zopfochytrium polystomum]
MASAPNGTSSDKGDTSNDTQNAHTSNRTNGVRTSFSLRPTALRQASVPSSDGNRSLSGAAAASASTLALRSNPKRSSLFAQDDDDENSSNDPRKRSRTSDIEMISDFGESTTKKPEAPSYVIPLIRTNNWRDAPFVLPPVLQPVTQQPPPPPYPSAHTTDSPQSSVQGKNEAAGHGSKEGACQPKKKWGLNVMAKKPTPTTPQPVEVPPDLAVPAKSLEEEAIEAIMMEANGHTTATVAAVPILQQNAVPGIAEITDAKEKYMHDYNLRPEDTGAEDYETIPIEAFGDAMMRGMGWTGESGNDAPPMPKPRPNLLGLGAKPLPPKPSKKDRRLVDDTKSHSSRRGSPADSAAASPSRQGESSSSSSRMRASSPRKSDNGAGRSGRMLREGAQVKIRKDCPHRGKTGIVLSIREKKDGIALKVEVTSKEIVRCWDDEVEVL